MAFLKKELKRIINKLPHRIQRKIFLAWFYLKRPIEIFCPSISTKDLILIPGTDKLRLIGFLKIHNEESSGNLERVLNHMKRFCDDIVVCDCQSTDNSVELAKKFTSHILHEPNDFKRELFTKQKMLEYALKLEPDWIVWLDADEVFDREGELNGIRKLCVYGDKNEIDGFSFLEYNLWKNAREYRVDEFWHKAWYLRLWKNNGLLKFNSQTGLHQPQHPNGLNKVKKSDIKVIHYGFASPEAIEQKYQMYKKWGQSDYLLKRFYDENNIRIKPFDIDWFPLSAFKVSVVCLIYKSISYIDFVWNSFHKYTKDANFLFIANDATDKVKNYLKENNLPHLIFENKYKNEYYLKRVYRAWNFGGFNAPGDIIVFVNSDMAFSKGWLENLLKNLSKQRIVCSRLIESGKMPSGQYGMSKDFGQTYKKYDDKNFQRYVKKISKPEIRQGGLFMPCAIYRNLFIKSGGYPIGNRKTSGGKEISGDRIFFYERLQSMGIKHYTSFDSIVYHIQEGEMDE